MITELTTKQIAKFPAYVKKWTDTCRQFMKNVKYKSILEFIESEYPKEWRNGNWGCCFIRNNFEELKETHPAGSLVKVIDGSFGWSLL